MMHGSGTGSTSKAVMPAMGETVSAYTEAWSRVLN